MTQKDLIFMEHYGAVDDLLSQLLLMTMEDKEVIGMNVTPADCFLEPAAESTYKILQLFNREDIEIGRSDYNGINAFPGEWRARPEIINALPLLKNFICLTLVLFLISCGTTSRSVNGYVENKVIPIRIVFLVDKESYAYKFKFLNRSQDTLEIVKPQPYFSYSHFSRITQDSIVSSTKCIIANMSSIGTNQLVHLSAVA